MKAYFDTNILIAALSPYHVHHALCLPIYRDVREGAIVGCLSAHGLAEFYSVMTRAPISKPIRVDEVEAAIEASIIPYFELIEVTGERHRAAITACVRGGWRGGRIQDAVHIQAAEQAQCDVIYTYNVGHFHALAPQWGERIRTPPPA